MKYQPIKTRFIGTKQVVHFLRETRRSPRRRLSISTSLSVPTASRCSLLTLPAGSVLCSLALSASTAAVSDAHASISTASALCCIASCYLCSCRSPARISLVVTSSPIRCFPSRSAAPHFICPPACLLLTQPYVRLPSHNTFVPQLGVSLLIVPFFYFHAAQSLARDMRQ